MTVQTPDPLPRTDDPTTTAFHDEVRVVLQERRADRRRLIDELAPVATPNGDPVAYTRMTAARATLSQIEAALARLDDGTYGVCVTCAAEIPAERLEIVPHTDSCVRCQSPASGRR